MYQHLPRIWYVNPYGLGLVLLCWQEAAVLTTKSFMGCPLPLSLTLTPLSVGGWGTGKTGETFALPPMRACEGELMATWCSEWICRLGSLLPPHVVNFPLTSVLYIFSFLERLPTGTFPVCTVGVRNLHCSFWHFLFWWHQIDVGLDPYWKGIITDK